MELFQDLLVVDGVDPLAHGVGHLTKPGVEDVENGLASVLDDAFFKAFDDAFLDTFLKAFFKGEFLEEGDVGHGFVG